MQEIAESTCCNIRMTSTVSIAVKRQNNCLFTNIIRRTNIISCTYIMRCIDVIRRTNIKWHAIVANRHTKQEILPVLNAKIVPVYFGGKIKPQNGNVQGEPKVS